MVRSAGCVERYEAGRPPTRLCICPDEDEPMKQLQADLRLFETAAAKFDEMTTELAKVHRVSPDKSAKSMSAMLAGEIVVMRVPCVLRPTGIECRLWIKKPVDNLISHFVFID